MLHTGVKSMSENVLTPIKKRLVSARIPEGLYDFLNQVSRQGKKTRTEVLVTILECAKSEYHRLGYYTPENSNYQQTELDLLESD